MKLPPTSLDKLRGVHPDLVRVVLRCADDWKDKDTAFIVTCGTRTVAEQKVLVANKLSSTMRSRHIIAPNGWAHAVDLAFILKGKAKWDWPGFYVIADAMKTAAKAEKVPLEWGGDWATFKDGPHFQLPWKTYPGTKKGK